MPSSTTALERAIANLGAVEVGPETYAYHADERFWIVDSYALADAQCAADREGQDDPSACLPSSLVTGMPTWWEPEQRFAVRNGYGKREDGIKATAWSLEQCRAHLRVCGKRGDRIITADLETGAEIPA